MARCRSRSAVNSSRSWTAWASPRPTAPTSRATPSTARASTATRYVLKSGVVKLFRPYSGSKEATLRLLKPWDIFGHLAFVGEARQRAYAEAVTECRVTKVPKIFMERAIRREPQAALKMMTLLELRLVQYEELVKCLLPRETEVRLA